MTILKDGRNVAEILEDICDTLHELVELQKSKKVDVDPHSVYSEALRNMQSYGRGVGNIPVVNRMDAVSPHPVGTAEVSEGENGLEIVAKITDPETIKLISPSTEGLSIQEKVKFGLNERGFWGEANRIHREMGHAAFVRLANSIDMSETFIENVCRNQKDGPNA